MQPEWMDLFLIGAVVLFAKLVDWQRRREGSSRSRRRSAAIVNETAREARTAAKGHEQALRDALREIR